MTSTGRRLAYLRSTNLIVEELFLYRSLIFRPFLASLPTKVEGALLELSRKQAELESREKQLAETAGTYLAASASPTNTALVPGV